MGDIGLQHELHFDKDSGIVNHQRERACVRRVYSAKIQGQKSGMTVAMYEGDGAEEVC
jgi:hypothetical protein